MRVFLCHASSDKEPVRALRKKLLADGFHPWLDAEDIIGGQEWDVAIREALKTSAAIIIALSRESITKEGYVQREIRLALDIAEEKPEGTIFILPVRLEECSPPSRLSKYQYIDLFDHSGYARVVESLSHRKSHLEGKPYGDELAGMNLMSHAKRNEFMVYEAAFLWYGYEPPSVELHWRLMPANVASLKEWIHDRINSGSYSASRAMQVGDGAQTWVGARWVSRETLRAMASERYEAPEFLNSEDHRTVPTEFNISAEAQRVLLAVAREESQGRLLRIEVLGGTSIQAGDEPLVAEEAPHRRLVECDEAITELTSLGYLRRTSREEWQMTSAGYRLADQIARERPADS